jgi:hypothetical protein
VVNAQAYYLYVGTTPGAKNLVDSREIQQTSFQVADLPRGQLLYARIWAKVGGIWRYTDSTLTAALQTTTLTTPANGATNVTLPQLFTWTSVVNAQAYYLYVGTTPGAKNLVDSREIQQTSFQVADLPRGQLLYARIWAKVGGIWRYTDSTFTTASAVPSLLYPGNGASDADLNQPFTWTTIAGAQAYYLYVGTTAGARNLIDTGELSQTSYLALETLPAAQTLYARIWARVGGIWRYSDSTFTSLPLAAVLLTPVDGGTAEDRTQPATWASLPGAELYRLTIGEVPGGDAFMDTGDIQATTASIVGLPTGQLLYARLFTRTAGNWRYTDSTFTAAPVAPEFVSPSDGSTGIDPNQAFTWTTSVGAQAYRLYLGTSPGGNDLLDSGEVGITSYQPSGLVATGPVYARIWAKVAGIWARHSDIQFSADALNEPAHMLVPFDGENGFDAIQPFEWDEVPVARGYRLTIGTTSGGSDVHDSGEIEVTQRLVPDLPAGVPLYGRISTKIAGAWQPVDFTFTVGANAVSSAARIKAALWATDFVRNLAADDNRPFGWSSLDDMVSPMYAAGSADYAARLLEVLTEVNAGLDARRLDLAFTVTGADAHALVEVFDPVSLRWIVLDPTFDVTMRRSDGSWATADDAEQATLALDWNAISYLFLGASGDAHVSAAYLDYPLYYLNVFHQGETVVLGQGNSPLPYLQSAAVPVSGPADVYLIQCSTGASATVVIDGVPTTVSCNGVATTSAVFSASTVDAPGGELPDFQLFRVGRFVF